MKKLVLILIAVGLLLGGGFRLRLAARERANFQAAGEAQTDPELGRAMLEAAKRAHALVIKAYSTGLRPFSDVYPWSRRWLEAERGVADDRRSEAIALTEHHRRMQELRDIARKLFENGQGSELDAVSAEYYVAEAASWLKAATVGSTSREDRTAPANVQRQARAMLEAARETSQATEAAYDAGNEIFSNIYVWSRRRLEAQRALAETNDADLDALTGHWQRMAQAFRKVKALWENGVRGGEAEKYQAAKFYVAEAELWRISAGGTVPDERN